MDADHQALSKLENVDKRPFQEGKVDERLLGDPGSSSFQVDRYPFFQLNRLVSRYNGVIIPRLRSIGLDIPFWRVLTTVSERGSIGTAELAEAAVIPLSTMTRIVQRMVAANLLEARESKEDARVTLVSLQPLGEAKVSEARVLLAPIYKQFISGLSERDFTKLLSLLGRVHANLDGL